MYPNGSVFQRLRKCINLLINDVVGYDPVKSDERIINECGAVCRPVTVAERSKRHELSSLARTLAGHGSRAV
jgi:hypothetical protein